jgi:hypothetical protein
MPENGAKSVLGNEVFIKSSDDCNFCTAELKLLDAGVWGKHSFRRTVPRSKILKGVFHNALYQFDFVVSQFFELTFSPPIGKSAVALTNKHREIFRKAVGHFDGAHNAFHCLVMPPEVFDFVRKILLNCASHARVKELGCAGTIEIAI